MRTTLILAGALALALFGNAWQWQNRSAGQATAGGTLNLCTTANTSQAAAVSEVQARMWECVGESQKTELSIQRAADVRAALSAKALAASEAARAEVERAYKTPDCADWGARPVCPAISGMYSKGGDSKRAGASSRAGAKAVPAAAVPD